MIWGKGACVVVALGAALLHAPAASAATCEAPSISGSAQVGATLRAQAGPCSDLFPPDVTFEWYRCTGTTPGSCTKVQNARSGPAPYTVAAADAGHRIGLKQIASGGLPPSTDNDWAYTSPVPEPPEPPPGTPPPPPPGGGGTGGGGGGGGGEASRLLSPFPVVTIAGRLTRRGARITLLSVRAPRGSRVRVRCRGKSCPAKRGKARVGRRRSVRLRRFQAELRAGTVLEVLVGKPGFVGKYTRFKFRARRPPLRTDGCLRSGARKPSACPA